MPLDMKRHDAIEKYVSIDGKAKEAILPYSDDVL